MNEEGKQPQYMQEREYKKLFGLEIYLTPVFVISSIAIVAFIIGSLVFQEGATKLFGGLRVWLTTNLDWLFMITANLVFIFCLVVAFSPLGKVRLGGADAKPDYSYLTWLAMLFAAGVGIGLLFFGVSEPITYFQGGSYSPLGTETIYDPETAYTAENVPDAGDPKVQTAASLGIATTVFHWGLQGWAIYGVVGLALAFFAYNRGLPLLIRSAFYPIFGDRIWGWPGHIIDTFAIFAGIFGLATSLGLGVQQVTSGLDYLFGIPATGLTMVVLIVIITAIALVSVMTGINVGIKRLSQFNIILAFLLLLAIIVLGPTLYIFRSFFTGLGTYFMKIVPLSNWIGREDTSFFHDWTTFY
ncbi:MAG: BCCT family transporter, partial [Candidatus Poribacteria bacterium]|nr:BCCT family transporter [Candidatus Poribacteria bacterium]